MHSLIFRSLVDFQEKRIEWMIQLITDVLISLPELWPLVLTAHISLACIWASSQADAVPWNKVPSYQCWTATNNSWRFCLFLLLLIFRASNSLRNTATFGIVGAPASICTFCCCFLYASVKPHLALRVIDQPLSFHRNFLDPFVSTSVNIPLWLYPFRMFTTSFFLKCNKHHYFQDYTKTF